MATVHFSFTLCLVPSLFTPPYPSGCPSPLFPPSPSTRLVLFSVCCGPPPPFFFFFGTGSMAPFPSPRETLLGQLLGYVRSISEEFNTKSNPPKRGKAVDSAGLGAAERQAPPTGKNLPGVVNNIVWTRQLEAKVSVTAPPPPPPPPFKVLHIGHPPPPP